MKTFTHKKKEYLFVTETPDGVIYRLRGGRKMGNDILINGKKIKELLDTPTEVIKLKK